MMAARGAWDMVTPRRPLKSRARDKERVKYTNTCMHSQENKNVRLRSLVLTRKLITSLSKIKRGLRRTTQVLCCSVLQCVAVLQCVVVRRATQVFRTVFAASKREYRLPYLDYQGNESQHVSDLMDINNSKRSIRPRMEKSRCGRTRV